MKQRNKITTGFVIQTFDDAGNCTEQEFFAGDQVDFEDEDGNPIEPWNAHFSFNMVQPGGSRLSAEGFELSDGGIIERPDDTFSASFRGYLDNGSGTIRRRDKDGCLMESRDSDEEGYSEWKELFREELARVCEFCDDGKPGRRTVAGHEEQCEYCGGTGRIS